MDNNRFYSIITKQRDFFATGQTLSVKYRISALKKLHQVIKENENDIVAALKADLGKCGYESYMCEIGLVLSEITYMIKHVKSFSREKNVHTPLAQFCSRSFIKPSPYGTVLIMSPWNYPFLLTLDPLVDAIAAGNTVVVKPSAYSPATSEVIMKLIKNSFDSEYIDIVTGGRVENNGLLHEKFDYIFFTGSQAVGKDILHAAAEYLTPCTLELGGKSPCIVDETADIKLAAKRIVFGKYLNCGQTCVAPDYLLCNESIKEKLVDEIKKQIQIQYGKSPLENLDYGKIINEKHFNRLINLIDSDKVVLGAEYDSEKLKISPTVMDNVSYNDKVMQEEIFGPILPIMTYKTIDEVITSINTHPHPLALYIFSSDKKVINKITSQCSFGGGCINDTLIHLATSEMGFGGVGESGMGSYHGKKGFETFSHTKSIVDKKTWFDLGMRYHPFTSSNEKLIRMFIK